MLKKFFVAMLGSMAAIWLSLIIVGIGILCVAISLGASSAGTSGEKTVLYINLTGDIAECDTDVSVQDLLSLMSEPSEDLATIITAIDEAAKDKKIQGIYINCAGSSLGVASRSEIIQALTRFKTTGKWVYAYADEFTQGDYYIATVADEVMLNPVGTLSVAGLSQQTMFYKNVLEKLGIDVEIVRVGSFKSAVEPFMRMDMSEASRLQATIYLNQIWDGMVNEIVKNRQLADSTVVNNWADSLCFTWAPERYVEQKAVNKLCYRSEVEKMIREKTKTKADADLPLITPTEYVTAQGLVSSKSTSKHVAVLYAVGEISQDGSTGIVSSTMVPQIEELAKDKNVVALVLRVNSPGGSAFASEQIWKALEDFKATGKPFYVSMGDYAASGGYYISCGADQIYSDPATLTGSIGIFGILPNAKRLVQDKIGLGIETVKTNPNANFPDPLTSYTTEQIAAMQKYIERGYETFTSRVSAGRGISVDSVKVIGGGRVWDGTSALNIGLVDHLGSLYDAVSAITEKVNLKKGDYVCYPKSDLSTLQTIMKIAKGGVEVNIDGLSTEEAQRVIEYVDRVRNLDELQARMEDVIIK